MISSKENYVPEISVVMAAHNEEKTIQKAVKSIIGQTFKNWELIIINDSSTDATKSILMQFESERRINVINNPYNLGLAKSLNIGISQSKGFYIARMDADDESLSNRLQSQLDFMKSNQSIDVLGGGAIYINKNKNEFVKMPKDHNSIKQFIKKSSPFIHPSVMYKKSFIDKFGGYDETILRAEDYDLWYRGIHESEYHNLEDILIKYNYAQRKILRSSYDALLVRLNHNPSKLSAIFWSITQFLSLIKNKYFF